MKTVSSLQNKLLIAMPNLVDPYFSHAVVYIYEHDETGSTGFIINKPMDITMGELLKRVEMPYGDETSARQPMLLGGPVKQEQLFLVHCKQQNASSEYAFHLPSAPEMLKSIAKTPEDDTMAFLGYASWTAGQLESEIKENSWLIASATYDLLYKVPFHQRYETATALMGFDLAQLSEQVGNA